MNIFRTEGQITPQTIFAGSAVPQSQDPVNNYGGESAVSFEVWQNQLAFERTPGAQRETIARTRDAKEAYDNYVKVWNESDAATRNAIDIQHGFAVAPPPPAPTSSGGGGGGQAIETNTFTDRIDEAADAPRNEITPPASGLEDTVLVEQTTESEGLSDTQSTVEDTTPYDEVSESRVVNNFAPAAPSDVVVDPATGQEYKNPAAARAAGITNWVYKDDYEAGA